MSGLCGATHPHLSPENTCREPAGHDGQHMAHDSQGRPEYVWTSGDVWDWAPDPAPSPAAEPPQGLRERWLASDMEQPWFRNLIAEITAEHRGDLAEWAERIARTYSRSGTLEITAVVWMLLDRIDVLLARLRDAEAAVERVEHVIALYRGYSGAYVDVAQIRRALSGDAR